MLTWCDGYMVILPCMDMLCKMSLKKQTSCCKQSMGLVRMVLRTEKEVQKEFTVELCQFCNIYLGDNPKSKWCKDSTKNTHLVAK